MYWPAMNADIEQAVNKCSICAEYQKQETREPRLPTITPGLPYSHVGTNVFDYEGKKYLILVDYYLKYIDAVDLKAETTIAVIEAMKTVFACYGLPGTLRSDIDHNSVLLPSRHSARTMELITKEVVPTSKASGEAESSTDGKVLIEEV